MVENLFLEKNPLQDLLSSLNAVISTNERIEFITGHVIFNGAHNEIFQLKTTFVCLHFLEFESELLRSKKMDLIFMVLEFQLCFVECFIEKNSRIS